MKCKYCGEEFIGNNRGRERTYCYKEKCIAENRKETQARYVVKKRQFKVMLKNLQKKEEIKAEENKETVKQTIIYSEADRKAHIIDMPDTGDILDIARQIGALRYQLVQMVQKEYETVGRYNKLDQDFLHKLENLESLTDEEATKLVIQEKKNRESRRVYKVRYYLIKCLLDAMPMKNPSAFIAQTIQKSKNYEYIPKVIDELKNDETFYMKKEN